MTMVVVGQHTADRAKSEKATQEAAKQEAQQAHLATLVQDLKNAERRLSDSEQRRRDVEQNNHVSRWKYEQEQDAMGRGQIRSAYVNSLNQVQFDFPYRGAQTAILQLRIHPQYGKDVLLSIERGQFLCGIDDCTVNVRFGTGKPIAYRAVGPADHSTTVLFIRNYDQFVRNIKKVEKVSIEARFYQEGDRVFEFDVSGLKWP